MVGPVAPEPRNRRPTSAVSASRCLRADETWCQLFSEPVGRAATSRTSRPAPIATAMSSSSTGRRSGRRTRTCATSRSCSRAPNPDVPKHRGHHALRSSTCEHRESRCARCARSPAPRTSTRCSSPTCGFRSTNVVGEIDARLAGGARGPRARGVGDRWRQCRRAGLRRSGRARRTSSTAGATRSSASDSRTRTRVEQILRATCESRRAVRRSAPVVGPRSTAR